MSPQLVDFDADGIQDMVMGTFEGVVFLVRGSKEGFLEPEYVHDQGGNTILLSSFWNHDTDKWEKANRSPKGERHPQDHQISAVAVDWDDDGDLDLLLGAKEGRLYLRRNDGKPGAPRFALHNELLAFADGEDLEVPGGLTAPRLVDWNADGLFDLVCGSFDGGVFLLENVGEAGAPAFEEALPLIPGAPKRRSTPTAPQRPDRGSYVEAVDYDGDGDLDLLVGGYTSYKPEAPVLTEEQRDELEGLYARESELDEAISDAIDRIEESGDEAHQEYSRLSRQKDVLVKRIQALAPREVEEAYVWLYRRR